MKTETKTTSDNARKPTARTTEKPPVYAPGAGKNGRPRTASLSRTWAGSATDANVRYVRVAKRLSTRKTIIGFKEVTQLTKLAQNGETVELWQNVMHP